MSLAAPAVARPFLRSLSFVYGLAVRLRNRRFDRPAAARRAPIPVLSVGNLGVGGTGKTPLVAWLARRLRDAGRRPAVVSRGYGGRAGRGPLVVSSGDGPRCSAAECGDEPSMLARALDGVLVVVGSDRLRAVEAAAEGGADVALLDDGFQHRRLARDLDVVLLDATAPFGNGRLLPAGPLREPVAGLGRADVIVLTRAGPGVPLEGACAAVRRNNATAPIVAADHRLVGFADRAGRSAAAPGRAVAFCAIGNPGRFRADLERAGIEIVAFRAWRDHHRYTAAELGELGRSAERGHAVLVTTEKDLARIDGAGPQGSELLVARIEAVVQDERLLLDAVDLALAAPRT